MKKLLFLVVFVVSVFCNRNDARGQIHYGISIIDTFTFTFGTTDSLSNFFYPIGLIKIDTAHIDSNNTYLWQIGNTSKLFFADSGSVRGIMTDTISHYPINANSWFVLRSFPVSNEIISFRHKYQTQAGRDGGIVEFSIDSGQSWYDVLCNSNPDSMGDIFSVFTDNFYGTNDTLSSGERAFSGMSSGWIESKIQFHISVPQVKKLTGGNMSCSLKVNSIIDIIPFRH